MRNLSSADAVPFDRAIPGNIAIADAIDATPLTVAPDLPLAEVAALMSQAGGQANLACSIDAPKTERRSSCALVADGQKLLGIFTERDIVRLTAEGKDFNAVRVADVMTSPVISMQQKALRDVFGVLFFFRRYRIRHLPIVGDRDELLGMITPSRIRQVLRPANLLKMLRVADVMVPEVVQAPPHAPVFELARMMAAERVSCVVIVKNDPDRGSIPIGIVTERDIAQFQVLQLDIARTPAHQVMSTPLFLLSPDDTLWDAHQCMEDKHVRRLVVSWNWGKGIGIVTQTSLLRAFDPMEMYGVIESLQETVRDLQPDRDLAENRPSLHVAGSTSAIAPEVETVVAALETSIQHLADRPELPASDRYRQLRAALAELARMRELLDLPERSRQVS